MRHPVSVAGVHYRKQDASEFASNVVKAMESSKPYGCTLKREPDNPKDPSAIAVFGWTNKRTNEAHIGYLPAGLADDIATLPADLPIAADFIKFYRASKGRLYFDLIVLIPAKRDAYWTNAPISFDQAWDALSD